MPSPISESRVIPVGRAPDVSSIERALQGNKKRLVSSALVAMSIFALANLGLTTFLADDSRVKGSANDSNLDLWSGAGSIDITVNGFRQLKQSPTVVLLGSSLIMHPFWSMDAELGKVGDIFHHHESMRLSYELGKSGIANPRVYSLAVFGEMISDAYIYVNDFLRDDKKPQLVFFGIAPRDFSDADLPSPTASFTFKRLVGLENFNRYANDFMPGWQERGDFVASHGCFLYGKRWRLQHEIAKGVQRVLAGFGIKLENGDASKNSQHAGFMTGGTRDERFQLSTQEYKRRYRGIGEKDLSLQTGFLNKILSTCDKRQIKVVLVNMPLTKTNRDLLPDNFYSSFRGSVKQVAEQHPSTQFLDLGDSTVFKDHDYWDTAHLNNLGGHKLLNCTMPTVVKALESSKSEKTY